jgi:hypothetical protein
MHNDTVSRRDNSLLAEIERGALDDRVPLATTLRKCILLGAQTRSAELRDWASQELSGYRNDNEIPQYRIVHAPLKVDLVSIRWQVRGQQVSVFDLPEIAREWVSEEVKFAHGVGAIEALLRDAQREGKSSVKLGPPISADVVKLMNYERHETGVSVTELYWDVHRSRIEGVLDLIRTTLVRLAGEMRAAMGDDASMPSTEQAAQAVSIVLHGGRRNQVNVNTAQAATGGTAEVTPTPAEEKRESGWTKTQTIWTVIGGVFAIIAVYMAYLQLRG